MKNIIELTTSTTELYVITNMYSDDDLNTGCDTYVCTSKAEAVSKVKELHDDLVDTYKNYDNYSEYDDTYTEDDLDFDIYLFDDSGVYNAIETSIVELKFV